MMYRNTLYKRNTTSPQHLLYKIAARDPRMQKQAANKFLRGLYKLGLSPFYLLGKPSMKLWNAASYKMSPKLSMHPKRMGWWGRTFGDRLKVQRNAQAIETARAARAFSKQNRNDTFIRMREQLPNSTGQRRANLEANMAAFDPATGWNRGKYFMQRAPDGKMHARKNRVQGMNAFTDFLNKGTAPKGTGATSAAQQAARQTQQAASNTAQQAAANTAQSASRAQQAAQQTAQQAAQQTTQQAASNTAQAAEQAASTAQQAAGAARPRPMKRPSGQSMSAAQWSRTRQGQQDLARRQARNRSAREAQQATQQAARSSDFNFRQPVDNGSFGPSFRQPVNNGGFGANFRQPVGQGNYSIAADNAFNTLSGRATAPRRAPRYAMPSEAEIRAGENATYLRDRQNLASIGIGRRGRGASSSTPVIHRNSTDQATERAAQNLREQILGRNRQTAAMPKAAPAAAPVQRATQQTPQFVNLDPATVNMLRSRFSQGGPAGRRPGSYYSFPSEAQIAAGENATGLRNIGARRDSYAAANRRIKQLADQNLVGPRKPATRPLRSSLDAANSRYAAPIQSTRPAAQTPRQPAVVQAQRQAPAATPQTPRYTMPSQAEIRAGEKAAATPAVDLSSIGRGYADQLNRSAKDWQILRRRILTSDNPSAVLTEFPEMVSKFAPSQKAAFERLSKAVAKQERKRAIYGDRFSNGNKKHNIKSLRQLNRQSFDPGFVQRRADWYRKDNLKDLYRHINNGTLEHSLINDLITGNGYGIAVRQRATLGKQHIAKLKQIKDLAAKQKAHQATIVPSMSARQYARSAQGQTELARRQAANITRRQAEEAARRQAEEAARRQAEEAAINSLVGPKSAYNLRGAAPQPATAANELLGPRPSYASDIDSLAARQTGRRALLQLKRRAAQANDPEILRNVPESLEQIAPIGLLDNLRNAAAQQKINRVYSTLNAPRSARQHKLTPEEQRAFTNHQLLQEARAKGLIRNEPVDRTFYPESYFTEVPTSVPPVMPSMPMSWF